MHGWNLVKNLGGYTMKPLKTEWQTCSEQEIEMFEDYYEEGATEIRMLGISSRLKEAYKDYFNWRINCDDGAVEILDED
jgi:hypothetical protein